MKVTSLSYFASALLLSQGATAQTPVVTQTTTTANSTTYSGSHRPLTCSTMRSPEAETSSTTRPPWTSC